MQRRNIRAAGPPDARARTLTASEWSRMRVRRLMHSMPRSSAPSRCARAASLTASVAMSSSSRTSSWKAFSSASAARFACRRL